jgi:hypothetical protein
LTTVLAIAKNRHKAQPLAVMPIETLKMKKIILTILTICNTSLFAQETEVNFDTLNRNSKYKFSFPDTLNNSYLRTLRIDYNLTKLLENKSNDIDKVLSVLNWTNSQWKHNGSNEPSKSDAITILNEVKAGKRYRCVEYGIVSTAALLSLNYKARVIGLKTKDVETTKSSAGHVLAEVWMPEHEKWVLIDGQFNIMPILDSIPLNSVEFQKAISEKKSYKLIDINGEVSNKRRKNYLSFIYDYLFYIDTGFEPSINGVYKSKEIESKSNLMLVPVGAKNPTIFQIKYPLDYFHYTNSLKDFYQNPN